MILRTTTSKFVHSNGRIRKSYAVAAATAASVYKNENDNRKVNGDLGSEAPNDLKLRGKRLPKSQRRVMVEAYVHKYKAMNDGKLPSTSNVVKQVGGSYYVVKKILQEVESQLKFLVVNNVKQNGVREEIRKEDEHLFRAKEVSARSNISENVGFENDFQMAVTNHVKSNDASDKHIEAETGSSSSVSVEEKFSERVVNIDSYSEFATAHNSLYKGDAEKIVHARLKKVDMDEVENNASDFIGVPSNLLQEKFKNVSHSCHVNSESGRQDEAQAQGEIPVFVAEENGLPMMNTKKVSHPGIDIVEDNKKKAVSEDLQDKDLSKDKTEWHEGIPEHQPVDKSIRQTSEAEIPKASTLWGNLKSFADGIFNIWRKS